MATQRGTSLKSLAARIVTTAMKALPHLSLIAAALFLFVGTAHAQTGPCPAGQFPCVLVSDDGQVKVYSDDGGTELNSGLLKCPTGGCPGGGPAGEGVSCLSGSRNVLYAASGSSYINIFNMNLDSNGQADWLNGVSATYGVTGLAVNGNGSLLYAASDSGFILSLSTSPGSPWLTLNSMQTTQATNAHDDAVGTCAPNTPCSYGGNIFTTDFENADTGVDEFAFNPNLNQMLPPLGEFLPSAFNCAYFAGVSGNPHCWNQLSGMAFDNNGNLWVNSTGANNVGTFEFAPGGSCGSPVCALNYTPDPSGSGAAPIGLTVAPAADPLHPGQILIANYSAGTVDIIDPICTGLNPPGAAWTPGTCPTNGHFINTGLANPKYVVYNQNCPDPDNNGYVEICKQSDPTNPVTGTFDFTVTAPLYTSGTIAVPVGYCSGSIQVPGAVPTGSVTIAETQMIGDLTSNVIAYSYDSSGNYVNQLQSWTEPNPYATVGVTPGDVSLETEAIFTNEGNRTGQLKICKIAGVPDLVNTAFNFRVTGPGGYNHNYTIPAGPPDEGGYCQLADTFPTNTPLTISEYFAFFDFYTTTISVACNACTYSFPSNQNQTVKTTIGAGITEVDFTNTPLFSIR